MEDNRELENQEQEVLSEEEFPEEEQPQGYVKRPWWQVALAWVGLAAFLVFVAYEFLAILRG